MQIAVLVNPLNIVQHICIWVYKHINYIHTLYMYACIASRHEAVMLQKLSITHMLLSSAQKLLIILFKNVHYSQNYATNFS